MNKMINNMIKKNTRHVKKCMTSVHFELSKISFIKIKKYLTNRLKIISRFIKKHPVRFGLFASTTIFSLLIIVTILQPFFIHYSYNLGASSALLTPINQTMANNLMFDSAKQTFNFTSSQTTPSPLIAQTNSTQVTVELHQDAYKGVTVTDSTNKVSFGLTPKYGLKSGQQDGNRIVYPLSSSNGWAVYTMQGTGVKEDIILTHAGGDSISFDYQLTLGDGLEARLEVDGSIGVYGNTLLSGNITASTENDAALLQKARENAQKNTLLFNIPKPFIADTTKKISSAKATYSLKGSDLQINVTGLAKANYPLSIDPSIYVVTAQQFMAGNNETNIDFDVDNKLIKKSPTTGARFDTWNTTTSTPNAAWAGGTVAAGGYIYTLGGKSFNGKVYTAQGPDAFTVPSGITSVTAKIWSGGGGGGGGSAAPGGGGGGSGYVTATYTVTPGEQLDLYIGGGGSGGTRNTSGRGGGGGGSSDIYRHSDSTLLTLVAGGGGGGGGRSTSTHIGGAGGAGGGTTGVAGSPGAGTSTAVNGGGGGTPSAGGAAGTGGVSGAAGSFLFGGAGGQGRNSGSGTGGGGAGGLTGGGAGGNVTTTSRAAGGGGGSGYYGGGGGSGNSGTTRGGAGGGGGSSYTYSGATSVTNSVGSGTNPGNPGDSFRNGAGDGGAAGATTGNGSNGSGGLIVITYGGGGSANQSVNWAKFNTSTGTVDSANPGNGTCSGWCTSAAYNLPSARSNFSLVTYNGFLYAMGGIDGSGTNQKTVYIAKLGANGEPQLWHPTDTNKANWVYWYQDANLSSIRSDMAAVAYNNRMYLMGGISTGGTPVNTVQYTDITPTGTLGSWTTSTVLPSNLYGFSAQVYNDRLYILGGSVTVGGAPTNSVYYIKLNSDGSLNNWIQTSSFSTGRMTNGGNFSVVWGAFIYISGGCSAVNGSDYCTTVQSDTQVSSINADGSIDNWNNIGGATDQRMSFGMVAWRNKVYAVGGCSEQNTSTGDCNSSTLDTINYGVINQDGDASTVDQSVNTSTSPCSDATPSQCNLPGTTYIGNMLAPTIITNGYLYVIGGCTDNACSTTLGNVAYVAISSSGTMTKPATCPSGTYRGNIWCVDTTHTVTGGIAAASPVIFGAQMYLVGGLDGTGNTNTIVRTTINNDGSIGAWTSQTMTGVGATSQSYLYAYARANPSSASTNPGNLFIFGGCSNSTNAGCTAYSQAVYKCNIQITTGAIAGCSTNNQQQIGIVPGDSATGLGIMSGTVYANYVYLIGGVSPNLVDLKTMRYAKIDNNNNVVAVSDNAWIESPNQMAVGRRRSASFGYNGYIYAIGGYEASTGVLADIEFIKINISDGSLGSASDGWHVSSVQINQRWGLSVPISNSFAYVIGGCTTGASPSGCTARTDIIQTFQIYNNDSGAPSGYTTSTNTYGTSPNRIGASSAILNGYIYVAGGCTSATDCTTAINTVSYAPIDVNGAIGTWSNTTGVFPSAAVRTWGKLVAAGGTLYYIGGQSSTATDERAEVYYGTPASGNVATWTAATNGLPAARTKFAAAVWNNRIYVVGGLDTNAAATSTVYVSPKLNTGGNITSAWLTTSTSLNIARSGLAAVAYANNLYIFGGYDGTNYLSDSQYAHIISAQDATDGTVDSWTYSESLPGPLSQSDAFAANGYIYLVGGRSSATTCDPVTLVAPVSANTTIASGNNPTGIGAWYETNQRYIGARYGNSAVYNDGKAYILGGGCGATLTYASPVTQQTTLLSQPQVAKYSIMIDADSDVFPNQWLLNGVDNSIGAKWQLKYRSMTNTTTSCIVTPMTTWGSETNFGDVTLGLPGIYTPKDSSGTSTNCARFYYFNVTVDSSQAFGYPDDVSRGPTITDLTLQFTADPSKRLMHGRTFIGGIQMPDDTPYYSY